VRKVKEFIDDGLQVKLTIFAKKPAMRKNPLAMDETTIKVLDCIEPFVGTVQPITRMAGRVDFILHPKKVVASGGDAPAATPAAATSTSTASTSAASTGASSSGSGNKDSNITP
jgi:hypothetical protein